MEYLINQNAQLWQFLLKALNSFPLVFLESISSIHSRFLQPTGITTYARMRCC